LITKTPIAIVAETESQNSRMIRTSLNDSAQAWGNKNLGTTIMTFYLNNSDWNNLAMRGSTEGTYKDFLCH
jgi:hypothetical protein